MKMIAGSLKVLAYTLAGFLFIVTVAQGAPRGGAAKEYLKDLQDGKRFTKDSQGIITDHQEGLQWLEKNDVNCINWYNSFFWIEHLFISQSHGKGWRFPTRKELRKLVIEGAGGGGSGNMDPIFTTYGKIFWSGEKTGTPDEIFGPPKKAAFMINFLVKGAGTGPFGQSISELGSAIVGYYAVLAVRQAPRSQLRNAKKGK